MVKLTEDMVAARAKTSDMESVQKLNFWGSDLTDISIIRYFKRAEILSFSLNQITTMADFQFCFSLCELCIRRNNIKDLREVCYLQDLPRLRRLLMTENPCCETAGDLYRPTVLRALPNLETLDNLEVTGTEREHARVYGLILEHPAHRKEKERQMAPGNRFYEGPEDLLERPMLRMFDDNCNEGSRGNGRGNVPSDLDISNNCGSHVGESMNQSQKSAAALLVHCVVSGESMSSGHNAVPIPRRAITVPQNNNHISHSLHSGHGHSTGSGSGSGSLSSPLHQQRTSASPILEFYRQELSYCCDRRHGQSQGQGQAQGQGQDLGGVCRSCFGESDHPHPLKQSSKNVSNNNSLSHPQHSHHQYRPSGHSSSTSPVPRKNNNIVAAILSLITDLDLDSLDLIELAVKRKRNECFY